MIFPLLENHVIAFASPIIALFRWPLDILPPELLNGLAASDADTFVAAVLSASCWSNLDTEVTEMFLRHAYTFIRNCCRRTCVHS